MSGIRIGQVLKGRLSSYTIMKGIYDPGGVWLAKNLQTDQNVIIKGVENEQCIDRERNILTRFQHKAPLRPLIDEIQDFPSKVSPIVLKYYDECMHSATQEEGLPTQDVKLIMKRVLEALHCLHSNDFIHMDMRLHNIMADRGNEGRRLAVLADFGDTIHKDHEAAKSGLPVGTSLFRSPETSFEMPWTAAADIWGFGTTILSLLLGKNRHIFNPDGLVEDEEFDMRVAMKQVQWFGDYPVSFNDVANPEALRRMVDIMEKVPPRDQTPFAYWHESMMSRENKTFLLKIMKMDPTKRPTAAQLLEDEWFDDV